MPIDPKTLKKMESPPGALREGPLEDDQRVLVLVKLRSPGEVPEYVTARATMGEQMFSAEVSGRDLKALEADPKVESVSISRQLPLIK